MWQDILFIIDPINALKPDTDSTLALMRVLQHEGARLWVANTADLYLEQDAVSAFAKPITFSEDYLNAPYLTKPNGEWFQIGAEKPLPLVSMQWVFMRKEPPFDSEFLFATYLLRQAEIQGAKVLNPATALFSFNEKLSIAAFPELIAPTLVTRSREKVHSFWHQHQDIIIKPLDGMGGMGVFRVTADGTNLNSILETLGQRGSRSLMVQRYLPEICHGDKRILMVEGIPVPYALARFALEGEVRANMVLGGTAQVQEFSKRDWQIATTVGAVLKARGIFFAGIDVIGDYLTEINITCPTGITVISAQTQRDIARECIAALKQR